MPARDMPVRQPSATGPPPPRPTGPDLAGPAGGLAHVFGPCSSLEHKYDPLGKTAQPTCLTVRYDRIDAPSGRLSPDRCSIEPAGRVIPLPSAQLRTIHVSVTIG